MKHNSRTNKEEKLRRFSIYRIIEHLALMALFLVLAITGLPQKFYHFNVAQSIIVLFGGIDNLRLIHHFSGVLFTGLATQHVLVNFAGIMFIGWEPSMLVTLKDVHDTIQNVRFYLGLEAEPAKCDHYTYKEKCIYWLVLIGGMQMIVTGMILWFPVAATQYLPGIFVPLSKMVHTSEAMLIFLLIVTWHVYDSVLSPDVFPLNKSIFTGYIGIEQMKRQHSLELAEMTKQGEKLTGQYTCSILTIDAEKDSDRSYH